MTIHEIERRTEGSMSVLRVAIDDGRKPRDYQLIAFPYAGYCTVYAGKVTRRSLGKTFHSRADLVTHYKRDGATLAQLVDAL